MRLDDALLLFFIVGFVLPTVVGIIAAIVDILSE